MLRAMQSRRYRQAPCPAARVARTRARARARACHAPPPLLPSRSLPRSSAPARSTARILLTLRSAPPQRAAVALHKLLDDLAKAHADAAASEVNNEQRFHQLEQETVTARC